MAARKKGTATLDGSRDAKLKLAVVLEALSGIVSTAEAAEQMGVSLSRYYQLELRALQGMLTALEPRERGPKANPKRALEAIEAEKRALQVELRRCQSLLRAATRSVGVKAPKKRAAKKRRRRKSRTQVVLQTLRAEPSEVQTDAAAQ